VDIVDAYNVHNAKFRHSLLASSKTNLLISYMLGVGAMQCAVLGKCNMEYGSFCGMQRD